MKGVRQARLGGWSYHVISCQVGRVISYPLLGGFGVIVGMAVVVVRHPDKGVSLNTEKTLKQIQSSGLGSAPQPRCRQLGTRSAAIISWYGKSQFTAGFAGGMTVICDLSICHLSARWSVLECSVVSDDCQGWIGRCKSVTA